MQELPNVNCALLGHIDSGKTTLAKALSKIASTASFDKSPQSQEKGITMDLGFSACEYDGVQITFIDCPGHAQLIRHVLAGSHIMDLMILVIDIKKGIQTQTVECLVLAEITAQEIIVVLNKIDLVEKEKVDLFMEKLRKKVFRKTKFKDPLMVPICAKDPQEDALNVIKKKIVDFHSRNRNLRSFDKDDFFFAIDHCFKIKGKGTVITGTVLRGTCSVGDDIELCDFKEIRTVKSIQRFKKSVNSISVGDRAGLLITDFKSENLERGYGSKPGTTQTNNIFLMKATRVRFFQGKISSRTKFHITIGHYTLMGKAIFFRGKDNFEENAEYLIESELGENPCFAIIELDKPIILHQSSSIIASRLDTDITHTNNSCRFAFYGSPLWIDSQKPDGGIKLMKEKERIAHVDTNENILTKTMTLDAVIGDGLLSKEVIGKWKKKLLKNNPLEQFRGMKCFVNGKQGKITGGFGSSGKFWIHLDEPLNDKLKGGEKITIPYRINIANPYERIQ